MTKRIRNRRFLFEQQLKTSFWDWSIQEKQLLDDWEKNKDKIFRLIFDRVRTLVEEDEFVEFAIVVHDKDVSYGTKLVEPHVHGYIDFPKQIDLSKVASALGLERERIETPKSKGGRAYTRINALAYLIHAKDKDKYQYPVNDVETFDTLDYETFINQNREDFEKYSATKKREKSDESLDLVLAKVYKGELSYFDIMKDDNLYYLMANNRQKFLEGFDIFGERESVLRLEALQNGEYDLTVLYIQGKPGIGKSTLARDIALEVQTALDNVDLKGSSYSASSKNPFDNYYGEEILFLDDLREDSLSASDWLKLFDPLNSARMSARYQNKLVVPRLIVMTAYMSPKQFFGNIKTEDLNQYLRRVNFSTEIAKKHGMEDTFYSVSEVKKNKANDHYQRSDGSSVVLNFNYEDLYSSQNKDEFITKLLEEYIYPRILPKKVKDVTND
ncbi:UNVERIFIED_CONTAM: plasmid replication protein [Streptococcus canis]